MALGATRTEVAGMILKCGARATAAGVAFGIAVAAGLVRLMAAAVPGLEGLNVAAVLIAASTLLITARLAGALPAVRAAAVDPLVALREQ
jgi:ABC-type antimicrobial peptide transport system permease subunit